MWIFPGWYPDGWWQNDTDVPCSNDELYTALDLSVGFDWDLAVKDVSLIDFNGVVSILHNNSIHFILVLSIYSPTWNIAMCTCAT